MMMIIDDGLFLISSIVIHYDYVNYIFLFLLSISSISCKRLKKWRFVSKILVGKSPTPFQVKRNFSLFARLWKTGKRMKAFWYTEDGTVFYRYGSFYTPERKKSSVNPYLIPPMTGWPQRYPHRSSIRDRRFVTNSALLKHELHRIWNPRTVASWIYCEGFRMPSNFRCQKEAFKRISWQAFGVQGELIPSRLPRFSAKRDNEWSLTNENYNLVKFLKLKNIQPKMLWIKLPTLKEHLLRKRKKICTDGFRNLKNNITQNR